MRKIGNTTMATLTAMVWLVMFTVQVEGNPPTQGPFNPRNELNADGCGSSCHTSVGVYGRGAHASDAAYCFGMANQFSPADATTPRSTCASHDGVTLHGQCAVPMRLALGVCNAWPDCGGAFCGRQ